METTRKYGYRVSDVLSVLAFSLYIRIIRPKLTQLPVTRLCPVHKNWLPWAVQKKKPVTKISCPDQHERYSIRNHRDWLLHYPSRYPNIFV